jgi:hypothetical protein
MKKILLGAALIVASVTAQAEEWVGVGIEDQIYEYLVQSEIQGVSFRPVDPLTEIDISSVRQLKDGVISATFAHKMDHHPEYAVWYVNAEIDCENKASRSGRAVFVLNNGSQEVKAHANGRWKHSDKGTTGMRMVEAACAAR